ncbi:MAG: CSLREA domain-containing protein [Arenicella sp.]
MNKIKTKNKKWQLLLVSLFFLITNTALAQETVCAVVKIEILQELTLERQAFEATLKIENTLVDKTIENIDVDVLFVDENEDPVLASSDPNNTNAKFFIRVNSLEGIDNVEGTGSLEGGKTAVVKWLIIPAPGSSGNIPSGKLYFVSADFNYELDGQDGTIPVAPDSIYVKPMPLLSLDYFLPRDVFADNPLTQNVVEPIEPFTLGVRVQNNGSGTANKLKIESAQPKIVENESGLLIDFTLLNSYVQDAAVNNSLLIDFGDIPSQQSRMGRWNMTTTLSGRFSEFTADFTHADELGGELTSLLEQVNTHTLIQDVLVDESGRDSVKDFLAADVFDTTVMEYDLIKVYESNSTTTPVTNQSATAGLNTSGDEADGYTFSFNPTAGFAYAEVSDPFSGSKEVRRVLRSDGKELNLNNVWFSRRYNRTSKQTEYLFSVFDSNTSGEYRVFVGTPEVLPRPPVIQFIALKTVVEGQQVGFVVEASDPDGTLPTLLVNNLPVGAVFEPLSPLSNLARGRFLWTPAMGQTGRYDVTFTATDGSLTATQNAVIVVNSESDTDGDGLPDAWEMEHFGDLDQDGSGDADGDGVSDYDEYLQGTDPNVADGPLAPTIVQPLNGATLSIVRPDLVVANSVYSGDFNVLYQFELSKMSDFSTLVDAYYAQPQGAAGQTLWRAGIALEEDQRYFWRVRAATPYIQSPWSQAQFVVNTENQLPDAPTIVAPLNNGTVDDVTPFLTVNNVLDPDGDELDYLFFVYTDAAGSNVLTQTVLQASEGGTTQWQVDQTLLADTDYYWQVAVRDGSGTLVETSINRFTVSLDETPLLSFTVNSTGDEADADKGDGVCATADGTCTLRAAIDEANVFEGKQNIYFNIPAQTDTGCDASTGVCTIQPAAAYIVRQSVNIDGYTQPGSTPNTLTTGLGLDTVLKVVVHGTRSGSDDQSMFLLRDHRGSELKGMAITGTRLDRESYGQAIVIYKQDDSTEPGHKFTGLFLGTDETGLTTIGNLDRGISITLADDLEIGGDKPEDRNLLMTVKRGIYASTVDNVTIAGNLIGTDITGMAASDMTTSNIHLNLVTNSQIGTLEQEGRNTLSGSSSSIAIYSSSSNDNRIVNNTIGTTVTEQKLTESSGGIYLYNSARNDVQKNVILASNAMIARRLSATQDASANIIKGNFFGVNSQGDVLNPGVYGNYGIYLRSVNNIVGGTAQGEGNVISNFRNGILLEGTLFDGLFSTGNTISGNSIFDNQTMGIDLLGSSRVTPNDTLDSDVGANNLQNFPEITVSNTEAFSGVLNSQPETTYRVELFANTACSTLGYGQGERFIGHVDVTTDVAGVADFFYSNSSLTAGEVITATATNITTGDTSEFSECSVVTEVGQLPTFTVDSTGDEGDTSAGDGVCATSGGACTLRAAIEEANAFAGKENIYFNIPAQSDAGCDAVTEVCTIRPEAGYKIFESVNIDAYTQPGSSPNTLTTDQGLNTVLKLVVHGEGAASTGSVFDFRDHRGSELKGMAITKTSTDRDIYGAAISVYRGDDSASPGHKFQGLFIGTDETGLAYVGEIERSMMIQGNANDVHIGGSDLADRNLMMAAKFGVVINGGEGMVVAGNLIGLDISGTNSSGMTQSMIALNTVTDSKIGGEQAGSRNILSGAPSAWGMSLYNVSGLQIENNTIGTTPQEQNLDESTRGIYLLDSSNNNVKGNVISAKIYTGIAVTTWHGAADDNILQGNYIGVNSTGDALSSGAHAITIKGMNNLVGGVHIGEGNTLTNYSNGVTTFAVDASQAVFSQGNQIFGNSIYNNSSKGIDLDVYSVAVNDSLDADVGNNGVQNFPAITAVTSEAIGGTLHSEPNSTYRVEFFASNECGASGYGQGEQFLGFTHVTTDDEGNVDFSHGRQSLSIGVFVTATATNSVTGNTSEFSQCVENTDG